MASTYICRKCPTTSTTKTVCVNGHISSKTFHARYSRAPLTSTIEAGRPSTTARKETKSVRSDTRHLAHFQTPLQQYRSKCAATQCVESSAQFCLGLRQGNLANDLPGNWHSILSYCCPVGTPLLKDTIWSRI